MAVAALFWGVSVFAEMAKVARISGAGIRAAWYSGFLYLVPRIGDNTN